MTQNKVLSGTLDTLSEESDSDDDLFAYLNTKGKGKTKQDKAKPEIEYLDLENTSYENEISHYVDCDVSKQQSTDHGTISKPEHGTQENVSCIETKTLCDGDFNVYKRQYLHHGKSMDVAVLFNKDNIKKDETVDKGIPTKSEVKDTVNPEKSNLNKNSSVKKQNIKSRNKSFATKFNSTKASDYTKDGSQKMSTNNQPGEANTKSINSEMANQNDIRSITAEMSIESWSPSHTESGKEIIAERVNEYLASFNTFDKFKSQEQLMTESDWEKRMMSRDSESESLFSSPMKIEVSLIEQDVTPVHSPISSFKYEGQNKSEENQAFIPNIKEGNRPLQYKFVRDGNKLKRITVVQDSPAKDILVDGVYHQANINNIGLREESSIQPQSGKMEYEDGYNPVEKTDIKMTENITSIETVDNPEVDDVIDSLREDSMNVTDVKVNGAIITTEVVKDASVNEVTKAEKDGAKEDTNEYENDDIDVETIDNEEFTLRTTEINQSAGFAETPVTKENVGEIEIHDSGVSIDADHQSTEDDFLYATVYKGAVATDSISQNTYGNPPISEEKDFTEDDNMNETVYYDSSFGNDIRQLHVSSANETCTDYIKDFNEKQQEDSGHWFDNIQDGYVNSRSCQNENFYNSDIIKKTDTDFVQYLENTCLSENASTTSQVSVCSNESPIVLKLGADGKLTECKTCPASHDWQEKKTEMDISFLAMRIQKIENDLSEMRRKSISQTMGNTGTITNVLNEANSHKKVEMSEDKSTNIDADHSINNTNSVIKEENNLKTTKTSKSEKNRFTPFETGEQSSKVNLDDKDTFKETVYPAIKNQANERKYPSSENIEKNAGDNQKPPLESKLIDHKSKNSETTEPSQEPKAFDILESLNISTSSFASSSNDESSQEDLGEYMVLDEEHLQSLFLQKLAEVKQIQSALKRKNKSKGKNGNTVGKKEIHPKRPEKKGKKSSTEVKERKVTRNSVCRNEKNVASKITFNETKTTFNKTKTLSTEIVNASLSETPLSQRKQTRSNPTSEVKHSPKDKKGVISSDLQPSPRSTKTLKRKAGKLETKKAKVKKKVTWNEKENNVKDNRCNTLTKQNNQIHHLENQSVQAANESDNNNKFSPNTIKGSVSTEIKLEGTYDSNEDCKQIPNMKITSTPTIKRITPLSSPKNCTKISPQVVSKKRKLQSDHDSAKNNGTVNLPDKCKRKAALHAHTRIGIALRNNQDIVKYEYETKNADISEMEKSFLGKSPKNDLEKLSFQVEYKRRKIGGKREMISKVKERTIDSKHGQSVNSNTPSSAVSFSSSTDQDINLSDKSPSKLQDVESKRRRLETIISEKLKSPPVLKIETINEQHKVTKDGNCSMKQNASTSKVRNKLGSSAKSCTKLREAKLRSNTKAKQLRPVQKTKLIKNNESRNNKKIAKIKTKFDSEKSSCTDKKKRSKKIRKSSLPTQRYGSPRTVVHEKRLAKSYDETWKDKLDSNAFCTEVLSLNDGVKRPINVKKLLKKILVRSTSSNTKSSVDSHKHKKRRREKRVNRKKTNTNNLKSSGFELSLSSVDVGKGGQTSFPGISLGDSAPLTSGECSLIRKNQVLRQDIYEKSSKGLDIEFSTEADDKDIPNRLENLIVSRTSEQEIVTSITSNVVSVSESEITESSETEENTEQESISNATGLTDENRIPASVPIESKVTANHCSSSHKKQLNVHTSVNNNSSSSDFDSDNKKSQASNCGKTSPYKSSFEQFKSLMDRRNNLLGKKNKMF